jgi:hypothetical protein
MRLNLLETSIIYSGFSIVFNLLDLRRNMFRTSIGSHRDWIRWIRQNQRPFWEPNTWSSKSLPSHFHDLVNKINLVHSSFFACSFLFSACFVQLCVHHQEKWLYQYDTWYLSLWVEDRLVCRVGWWAHSYAKHLENRNKHKKKELCNMVILFTRIYKDARSTKHKILFHDFSHHVSHTCKM